MFKLRYVFISILLFSGVASYAQQEVQLTHFMFNQLSFNPGYTGSREAICVNLLARQQWVGFMDGEDKVNPQTNLFTLDAPVDKIRSGLGIMFLTDKLGFEENLQIRLNYAYRLNVGQGKLGLGISAGFLDKKIDFSKFRPLDPDDPIIVQGQESDMLMDFAFGAYYEVQNRFYVGVSSSQLSEAEFSGTMNDVPYSLKRHYYLTGGYYYPLAGQSWVINPNILLKSDLGSTQIDFNAMGIYNNKLWGGLSFRANDAVSVLVGGFPIDQGKLADLRIGYSYDVTTSKLGRGGRSSGSHELYAAYCFKIVIPKSSSSYSNVRYLPTL